LTKIICLVFADSLIFKLANMTVLAKEGIESNILHSNSNLAKLVSSDQFSKGRL
jgi:hypothetical protein